jgi:phosphoserine phosphatase
MKHFVYLKFSTVVLMILLLNSCDTGNEATVKEKSDLKTIVDPLPSWNPGPTKSAIINYVEAVTDVNGDDFIPIEDRIATFDNDGNLWSEKPAYFQLFFAIDKVKAMAEEHPEWKNEQPFKAVLENDMEALAASGEKGILELVMATHSGNTTDEFESDVQDWIKSAVHPIKKVSFDKLVFQPMLELLQFLRANEFKTYIVSGGGVDFMRAFVTDIYGIPKEQILGSRIKTSFDYNDGNALIKRLPEIEFIDDKDGKPLNIQKIIGKKPVFASGNSDGDLPMMQWTASNSYKSFMLYLHHTDAEREWAYDKESHVGKLEKGLEQAKKDGWTVIDMKNDWKVIYPFELN